MYPIVNEQLNDLCVMCGENHLVNKCNLYNISNYILDKEIPSKARLTLPEFLSIRKLSDGFHTIITNNSICKGTKFGPIQSKLVSHLNPLIEFPLKIISNNKNDDFHQFLDTTDENEGNWLIFIRSAKYLEEQNLICYQEDDKIYFLTIRDIEIDENLKVWYSPYYAKLMGCDILNLKPEEDPLQNYDKDIDLNMLVKSQQNIIDRKSWTCKFCSQNETDIIIFAKHILKHYTSQMKKICKYCNYTFHSKKSLKTHLKVVHNQQNFKNGKDGNRFSDDRNDFGGPLLNELLNDTLEDNSINLNQIDLNIDNQILLDSDYDNLINENVKNLDHFNFEIDDIYKQFVCDICLKQFTKLHLLIIHLKHHTADFICYQCLKIFCRKENLINHSCNFVKKFTCDICNKRFTQKKYLSRHYITHTEKFKCNQCLKTYYSNKELQEHNCKINNILNINNNLNKRFICSICHKAFSRDRYLRLHMETHNKTNEKNEYVCDICGIHLARKTSYYLHRKIHEGKKYSCKICGKKFHRLDTCNFHIKTHEFTNKFECEVCHKKLKSKKVLYLHVKNHKQSNSYNCINCKSVFKHKFTLKRHIEKNHSKTNEIKIDDNYHCPICLKKIKLRSSLLRHIKQIHPNENLKDLKLKLFQNLKNINTDKNFDSLVSETLFSEIENNQQIKEVCLSIPDLTEKDQEITLDTNAYIMDNGNIVQPQGNEENFIIYMLDQQISDQSSKL